jgi:hypothetical protein
VNWRRERENIFQAGRHEIQAGRNKNQARPQQKPSRSQRNPNVCLTSCRGISVAYANLRSESFRIRLLAPLAPRPDSRVKRLIARPSVLRKKLLLPIAPKRLAVGAPASAHLDLVLGPAAQPPRPGACDERHAWRPHADRSCERGPSPAYRLLRSACACRAGGNVAGWRRSTIRRLRHANKRLPFDRFRRVPCLPQTAERRSHAAQRRGEGPGGFQGSRRRHAR